MTPPVGAPELPWVCIAVLPKRDAGVFALSLIGSGAPCIAARDADGERWHIAVRGGLAGSPTAWIVALRGEAFDPWTCAGDAAEPHEQTPCPVKVVAL
jgi:hypothetical protein